MNANSPRRYVVYDAEPRRTAQTCRGILSSGPDVAKHVDTLTDEEVGVALQRRIVSIVSMAQRVVSMSLLVPEGEKPGCPATRLVCEFENGYAVITPMRVNGDA